MRSRWGRKTSVVGLVAIAMASGLAVSESRIHDSIHQAMELTRRALHAQQTSEDLTDIALSILGAGSLGVALGILLGGTVGYAYWRWQV